MIKAEIEINDDTTDVVVDGNGNKKEMYVFLGLLEEIKFKMISFLQQNDSSLAFFAEDRKLDGSGGGVKNGK